MTNYRIAGLALAGLICASFPALAEDAISHPASKTIGASSTEMVASLGVINADGASLEGNKLTLTGVSTNTIVFADRPVRAAGHVLTAHFIREWDEGNESFAKTPPNATISVFSKDGTSVKDAVIVLKTPKLEGDKLTFDVSVLEGDLAGANEDGAAALFIDRFAVHYGGGGWGHGTVVVGRGPAWHGAWYAHPGAAFATGAAVGAAVGAAAAAPGYYGAPCGYYPYPPCY